MLKPNKPLMKLLTISFILILSGCINGPKLKIPNVEWCRDKGPLGAHCNKQLTNEPRELPLEQWDEERFGQFCTTEKDFAKNQLFVIKACQKTKGCDVEKLRLQYNQFMLKMKK